MKCINGSSKQEAQGAHGLDYILETHEIAEAIAMWARAKGHCLYICGTRQLSDGEVAVRAEVFKDVTHPTSGYQPITSLKSSPPNCGSSVMHDTLEGSLLSNSYDNRDA